MTRQELTIDSVTKHRLLQASSKLGKSKQLQAKQG